MHTQLTDSFKQSRQGQQAETIIRNCVHCGFCNAVCPTYQIEGNELDGPRGRIYLIKQILEGQAVTTGSLKHLDRCLSCKACETVCPSGVNYTELLDIGRHVIDKQYTRPWKQHLLRQLLLWTLPYPQRFRVIAKLASYYCRPFLPKRFLLKIPEAQPKGSVPVIRHQRRMLIMEGCVQPILQPNINAAATRILDKLGISVLPALQAVCCGALPYHLGKQNSGLEFMRRSIDLYWPQLEQGIEAIVVTASGCGVTVKDYGRLLQHDADYAEKAAHISSISKDLSEILVNEDISALQPKTGFIAFHSPCSLQHGLGLNGVVENLLIKLGFTLSNVKDAHLCCGSAGSYSILQPELAGRLRTEKLNSLEAEPVSLIATANIGCLLHLQEKAKLPVLHWIELLDTTLAN